MTFGSFNSNSFYQFHDRKSDSSSTVHYYQYDHINSLLYILIINILTKKAY